VAFEVPPVPLAASRRFPKSVAFPAVGIVTNSILSVSEGDG